VSAAPSARAIIFDLDGTLVDSAPGIATAVALAYEEVGVTPPPRDEIRTWIGPPVQRTLERELAVHGGDVIATAQAAFRRHYDALGAETAMVFDGIHGVLAHLQADGAALAVATHKPQPLAGKTLEATGLASYFVAVHAPPDGGTPVSKPDLVAAAIADCGHPADVVVVGDRAEDIEAAVQHHARAVGVMWGYGSPEELHAAGAIVVVQRVAELYAAL